MRFDGATYVEGNRDGCGAVWGSCGADDRSSNCASEMIKKGRGVEKSLSWRCIIIGISVYLRVVSTIGSDTTHRQDDLTRLCRGWMYVMSDSETYEDTGRMLSRDIAALQTTQRRSVTPSRRDLGTAVESDAIAAGQQLSTIVDNGCWPMLSEILELSTIVNNCRHLLSLIAGLCCLR